MAPQKRAREAPWYESYAGAKAEYYRKYMDKASGTPALVFRFFMGVCRPLEALVHKKMTILN